MSAAEVVIVGGGPAGLSAALELRRLGVGHVVVVEREQEAGGIPRHAAHTGFGLRDMHRLLNGPRYAARYVRLAVRAGVELRAGVSVTDWAGPRTLALTGAGGLETITADAVLLATGCRERPRAARLVPGSRPLGVLTTGALQQLVYLYRQSVGRRAVVVGAEHVSFSAVLTLAHAGAATVAMVTTHPCHQSYAPFKWITATRYGVPILTASRVTQILGRQRVEAVDVQDLASGALRRIDCDTVVFTGDWIPDNELARRGGLAMDPATRAPLVDQGLRCSVRGIFAAGNVLHAAETADVAALSGRHAARAVQTFLASDEWPERPAVPVECVPPLIWASPSAIDPACGAPPLGRFLLRVGEVCTRATLCLSQAGRPLWRRRYRRLVPNLPIHVAMPSLAAVDRDGGPVRFFVEC